ncbi:putative quinol monooxygenase [Methylobrevis albus]|uniref:Antibiotic biosynthesis monooxygenase n=1 Tax=Methylobrevis albus TaxID=2793297 RepID=A0A931MYJ7_9HYPH|nr:putative quinol monooxygenase [Methylobrevis albus]MBH0238492.1 antibiotic biosynthesis monooxygenase [Methylobrevis albus]
MSFVIAVDFDITPGAEAAFLDLVSVNAADSVRLEPGCQRFDVTATADGRSVFLYEIYDDEAAFRAHLETAHYLAFDRASAAMIAAKSVRQLALKASPEKQPA